MQWADEHIRKVSVDSIQAPTTTVSTKIVSIYASVNSKPAPPPPGRPRGFTHSSFPGVGFSLLCFARGFATGVCPQGVLNQSKSWKKCDLVEALFIYLYMLEVSSTIYTITNMQHIRIYSGKLKSFLVKILPDPGR